MPLPRDETRTGELMRYARFTAEDAAALARARARVTPHFERIAGLFYERIREHEGAHAVLSGDDQIARLQRSLAAWLDRLFGGIYDEAYFAKTAQIGRVHVRVGLPQRYIPTAMGFVRSALFDVLDRLDDEPARRALCRLLDVELAVMLDAHDDYLLARVERASHPRGADGERRATPFEENSVTAIEISPLLVVGIDEGGTIALFNRAAERVSGYAQDEIVGRDFVSALLPEGAGRPPVGATSEDIELPLVTRSGRTRMIRWRIARAERSAITFAFGLDVTDDVAARERALHERRLAAINTLTTGLAHEIRNPLNGARLHAEVIERALAKTNAPEARDAVRVVKGEIQRLARLVEEFLEFAQPRPLTRRRVDARVLVERVVADQPNVRADVPSGELAFAVDVPRLEEALRALVANAVEAGAASVVVRVRREPRVVRFEVEDDGPGFDPRAPVFDAFYTTKADGTGLGLAIVHRTVTDHGGTIDVESRPGYTRFRLMVPWTLEGTSE